MQYIANFALQGKTMKILVADGFYYSRKQISLMLQGKGISSFDIYEASTDQESLQIIKHEKIGLAIIDLNKHQLDGFKLIEQIRKSSNLTEIPIIPMADNIASSANKKLFEFGIEKIVEKTPDMEKLWTDIKHLLEGYINDNTEDGAWQFKQFIEELIRHLNVKKLVMLVLSEDHLYWNDFQQYRKEIPFYIKQQARIGSGLSQLKTAKPSLVIIDFHLGKDSIYRFLEKGKEVIQQRKLAIVVSFDSDSQSFTLLDADKEKMTELGVTAFINKNDDFQKLYEKMGLIVVSNDDNLWMKMDTDYIKSIRQKHLGFSETIKKQGRVRYQYKDLQAENLGIAVDSELGLQLDVIGKPTVDEKRIMHDTLLNIIGNRQCPNLFIVDFSHIKAELSDNDIIEIFDFSKTIPTFQNKDLVLVVPSTNDHFIDLVKSHPAARGFMQVDDLDKAKEYMKERIEKDKM